MDPLIRFQIQVLRVLKAGELKAKKKVKLYEGLLRDGNRLDAPQDDGLKFALEQARTEVKLYRRLLADALRKARKARKAK
ncbi:MAG: hypothetical protein ABR973_14750 [Candidatus Acidiferrales bacterium]|jgi:hypothetical protein